MAEHQGARANAFIAGIEARSGRGQRCEICADL
jgi:hypothetical protein